MEPDAHIAQFLNYLTVERGTSSYTLRNYQHALAEFSTWYTKRSNLLLVGSIWFAMIFVLISAH